MCVCCCGDVPGRNRSAFSRRPDLLHRTSTHLLEEIITDNSTTSPSAATDQAAADLYNKYAGDECLPVETIVNLALLLLKARRVIQFDMNFYDPDTRRCIQALVDHETCGLGSKHDSLVQSITAGPGNVVLYLKADSSVIEEAIEAAGGVGSAGYARLLDPTFYNSRYDVKSIYSHFNLSMVSINVVKGKRGCTDCRSGALLVQMLAPDEVDELLPAMYGRFVRTAPPPLIRPAPPRRPAHGQSPRVDAVESRATRT